MDRDTQTAAHPLTSDESGRDGAYLAARRGRKALTTAADLVELSPDHPGFRDAAYRRRRNTIARLAMEFREGDPVPHVRYTAAEHGVWQTIRANLDPLHRQLACREVLDCAERVALRTDRIPQLSEVNETLSRATGFQMVPVAGLVSDRQFLGCLARGVFLSTQYIRHPSEPRYTPEPDVVHELIGHAATFAHPLIAKLNRAFGEAAGRVSDSALQKIARVYWFTMEFGVLREGRAVKALGAGLLSSFGELGRFQREAELRSFDVDEMSEHVYDPTQYQSVLYVADSLPALANDVTAWLARQA